MRIVACCVVLMLTAVVAVTRPDGAGRIGKDRRLRALDERGRHGRARRGGHQGTDVRPRRRTGRPPASTQGSGLHRIHLNVIPLTAASAGMYKSLCAQKKKDGLTGLGDTTCWYNDKHEELQVLKGTTFFSIELRRSGDPTEPIKAVGEEGLRPGEVAAAVRTSADGGRQPSVTDSAAYSRLSNEGAPLRASTETGSRIGHSHGQRRRTRFGRPCHESPGLLGTGRRVRPSATDAAGA